MNGGNHGLAYDHLHCIEIKITFLSSICVNVVVNIVIL